MDKGNTELGQTSLNKLRKLVENLGLISDVRGLKEFTERLGCPAKEETGLYLFAGNSVRIELAHFWRDTVDKLKIGMEFQELYVLALIALEHGDKNFIFHPYKK